MTARKINAPGLARLPAFCHAVVAGDFIYVSGTLGTQPDSMKLAEGGTGPETIQALRNIEIILKACGATLADIIKVNVFLADMRTYSAMNEAYMAVMGSDPPRESRWVEQHSPSARQLRSMPLLTNQKLSRVHSHAVESYGHFGDGAASPITSTRRISPSCNNRVRFN
jgi:2-iminobutanoate/2-iminopropanoate deaminase